MLHRTFVVWDCLMFGLVVAASVGIGIFYAFRYRKQRNIDEYLFAGRSMSWFPVAISLLASFESSIMMLGTPAEAYAYGIQWILGKLSTMCGNIFEVMLLIAFVKNLNLVSPFQYLEARFRSRPLRLVATGVKSISYLLYISLVLYGQGIALQTVTGFSMVGSILVTATAAVIYTTIGGLRAVIWTDVLQLTFMVIGMLTLTIKGTIDAGGVHQVWGRAKATGRLGFNIDADPTVRHTVWNLTFPRFFYGLGFLFYPYALQRISSTRSVTQARRGMMGTVILSPILVAIALFEGIAAYGYYSYKRCDPVESKQVDSLNQIAPYMILDVFRNQPGVPGLFLAAIFSASLSTLSSCYSALANITLEDFIRPCVPTLTESKALVFARSTVVVYGVLSCACAFVVSVIGAKSLIQITYSLSSVTEGPLTGLFYLGIFFPFVNTKSAIIAVLTSVSFLTWLVIGSNISRGVRQTPYLQPAPIDKCPAELLNVTFDNNVTMSTASSTQVPASSLSGLDAFYSLSYTLYSCLGILLVLVVGVVLSVITGGNKDNMDPRYVFPLREKLARCLPRSVAEFWPDAAPMKVTDDELVQMKEKEPPGDE